MAHTARSMCSRVVVYLCATPATKPQRRRRRLTFGTTCNPAAQISTGYQLNHMQYKINTYQQINRVVQYLNTDTKNYLVYRFLEQCGCLCCAVTCSRTESSLSTLTQKQIYLLILQTENTGWVQFISNNSQNFFFQSGKKMVFTKKASETLFRSLIKTETYTWQPLWAITRQLYQTDKCNDWQITEHMLRIY